MANIEIEKYQKQLVKVKQQVLQGYPLLSLRERDLLIASPYLFTSLSYQRPLGASKMGTAEVELFAPDGKFVFEKIYFEFAFSERERIAEAQKPSSFFVKQTVSATKSLDDFSASDFTNTYQDVVIDGFAREKTSTGKDVARLVYHFNRHFHPTESEKSYNVLVSFDSKTEEVKSFALTETIQVNVLRDLKETIESKLLRVENLEHFSISEEFLKGSAPQVIDSSVIIPKKYIELVKVDYFPPKDIDSTEAQFLVDYKLNGRINSERVNFNFSSTIRDDAQRLVGGESVILYKYIAANRLIPPVLMDRFDFTYNGRLPIEIVGVEYDPRMVDPDSRLVEVTLQVKYRTAIIPVKKVIEFQYSLNEYAEQGEVKAKVENKAIVFDGNINDMTAFYETLAQLHRDLHGEKTLFYRHQKSEAGHSDANFFETSSEIDIVGISEKLNELIKKHAKVAQGYNYSGISKIKMINFDPNSRTIMFKVTVEEPFGDRKFMRSFEKHVRHQYSYNEWLLDKIHADNIKINDKFFPKYPEQDLSERVFERSTKYRIVSYQYRFPGENAKEAIVQVELESGERTKLIEKKLVFEKSYRDHVVENKLIELKSLQRLIKPSDISIAVDLRKKAPEKILPTQIFGIPNGFEVKIVYEPPRIGEHVTRLVLEIYKDGFVTGFEQTLIFDVAS